MWSLFKELRLHNKLAAQRNHVKRINLLSFSFLQLLGGLPYFLGVIMLCLKKSIINLEAYQALNTILPLVLSLILMRFPYKSRQHKYPYLLLPIRRSK